MIRSEFANDGVNAAFRAVIMGLLGLGGAYMVARLLLQGNGRAVVSGMLMVLVFGLALTQPRAAIALVFVFLSSLGIIRRALIPLLGWSSQDPILMVGPMAAIMLAVLAVMSRRVRLGTRLSKWLLVLMAIMSLQILNPAQGDIRVGLAGALFYIIPLLWFWVGQAYAGEGFMKALLFRLMLPLALLGMALGYYQAFFGLLPFEQSWVEETGYTALFIQGFVRPISIFTSAAEYAYYMAAALLLFWVLWLRGSNTALLALPALAGALVLEASRSIVVISLVACALLWTVQGRNRAIWAPRLALSLLLAAGGLAWSLSQASEINITSERARVMIQHQSRGLLNPFDTQHSTAMFHAAMFVNGIWHGFTEPLGIGLGATTLGAGKFSGRSGNAEIDLSNMFISLGVFGGLTYLVVIVLVLFGALTYWHRHRTMLGLAILGLLLVAMGQWLNGGFYSVSMLIWLCIGALDRLRLEAAHAGGDRQP